MNYTTGTVHCDACGRLISGIWTTVNGRNICDVCYHFLFPKPQATGMLGWICPKCGRGLSPFVSECPCGPDGPLLTTDSGTGDCTQ